MDRTQLHARLPDAVTALHRSVEAHPHLSHLNRVYLPCRDAIVHAVHLLRQLAFPGFFCRQVLNSSNLTYHLGQLMVETADVLFEQVRCCLRYRKNLAEDTAGDACDQCDHDAARIVHEVLERLPAIRELLAGDVQAAFHADPAAHNTDETILCYPGLLAITVQRFAHEFYVRGVPMLPRIMTEWAHSQTGIDIHPGARLGPRFFIDHGTGIVIGETAEIGANVRIYQGVTLGGLHPDRFVEEFRGKKRHPTIEDDVTIYAGATILGGDTVIGRGCIIGGNVFLTTSVPPYNLVSMEAPKLRYRPRRGRTDGTPAPEPPLDFQI